MMSEIERTVSAFVAQEPLRNAALILDLKADREDGPGRGVAAGIVARHRADILLQIAALSPQILAAAYHDYEKTGVEAAPDMRHAFQRAIAILIEHGAAETIKAGLIGKTDLPLLVLGRTMFAAMLADEACVQAKAFCRKEKEHAQLQHQS